MNNWSHADFVCAAYAVTALVLAAAALQTFLQWRRLRGDYNRLFGRRGEKHDA